MEDSVHIHGLVRFVTGFLGRGKEEKKKHEAVNSANLNAPSRKFKELKRRNLNFLIFFLPCFQIRVKYCIPFGFPFSVCVQST